MHSFQRSFRFSDKPLFKDADILECDHIPDQVLFRDDELEELAFLIRPGLRGQRPANILCRGLPATGKTTCIHHLFAEIRHLPDTGGTLIPVYVNCQRSRTAFAVFSTIYRELVGHAPPSSGIPLMRLMDAVAKALQSKKAILLVCLDDIHHLIHEGTATQILSSLLRIYLDYPGCRASVILVESNPALDLSRALDRSVTSSLCAQEVFFAPYTANQIRGILKERARQAVYPGVIAPGILDLITERTTGTVPVDIRVGIDLLKRSILRAERAAHTTVTAEDVAAAYGDACVAYLRGLVSGLTVKERALLSLIATMTEEAWKDEAAGMERRDGMEDPKTASPTSGQIYSRLQEIIEDDQLRRRSLDAAAGEAPAGNAPPAPPSRDGAPSSGNASPPPLSRDGAPPSRESAPAACAEPEPGYSTGKRGTGRDGGETTAPSSTSVSNSSTSYPSSTLFPYRSCSYTSFYEQLRSLESYSLIRITSVQGRGKTSAITLRYAAADVKRLCDAEEARQGEGEKK